MPQHKSISQKLKRAKTPEDKIKNILAWSEAWKKDTDVFIKRLESAIKQDDYDELCISLGRLKEDLTKRFTALPKVLDVAIKLDKGPN